MGRVVCHVSTSLDGFLAGPDQSEEQPLGAGGHRVHTWHLPTTEPRHPADAHVERELMRTCGAVVMGRNMFGPVRGPWTGDWRGWWGEEPPFHAPVFVLTHHAREPVEMAGGTTFTFVTTGFDAALEQARGVAGDGDVRISGGASTARQALAAGAVDELWLDVAPVLLGRGERLFVDAEDPGLEPLEVHASPLATHIRYRIGG